uniref:Uncharacterized protein n=1 Tax=Tanacetum cinerariifolium TaxID=118510 RepID=A0A6L2LBP4_TANCI|nr:hypothetical protein [Tanacetum cinerariifolium]
MMDDPNITMEEYIKLEEEKARRRDMFKLNLQLIIFGDETAPEEELSCESKVSDPINKENDFRISFDKSDDEDYTIIYDKNSFSYKMISVENLKMNSEDNLPSFPSPEPTVSYFDDLDYFRDFDKEFPTIVYNDVVTSKLDFLTEPTISPQHIDEFNLKDETSLSECDKEEQNVLNFKNLFPFNVIYPADSKSDKDNDDDKIEIEQSSRNFSVSPLPDDGITVVSERQRFESNPVFQFVFHQRNEAVKVSKSKERTTTMKVQEKNCKNLKGIEENSQAANEEDQNKENDQRDDNEISASNTEDGILQI